MVLWGTDKKTTPCMLVTAIKELILQKKQMKKDIMGDTIESTKWLKLVARKHSKNFIDEAWKTTEDYENLEKNFQNKLVEEQKVSANR